MTYVRPQNVVSPRSKMTLDKVLLDGGSESETSYALLLWHPPGQRPEYVIGTRWNGSDGRENGTPNISGHACWYILDRKLWPTVLAFNPDAPCVYAVEKLYGGGNGGDLGSIALEQED